MLANIRRCIGVGAQAASLAAVVLVVSCVVSLGARTSVSPPIPQPEFISVASTVDRTHKGDRLSPLAPAAERKVILIGCDPPFSPLAKSPPSIFSARCLT